MSESGNAQRDIGAEFKALRLHGMASAWPEVLGTARLKTLDHETVLHQLLKAESAQREVRSMAYQMRIARFQSHRDLAGFDFTQANVDEALVLDQDYAYFSQPVQLKSYTVATLPGGAAMPAGSMIYVSNESGGAVSA